MSWTATLTLRPWTSLKTPSWTPSSSNRNRVATGRSPPSGVLSLLAILAHRLPRSIVHGHHGPHHPDAIHVLQVEQVVERPVQVVGQQRYLLPERFGGGTHHCVVSLLLLPTHCALRGISSTARRRFGRGPGSGTSLSAAASVAASDSDADSAPAGAGAESGAETPRRADDAWALTSASYSS